LGNITVVQAQLKALNCARYFRQGCSESQKNEKTGAYSPPRFSAPALESSLFQGLTRPLICFRPTCSRVLGAAANPGNNKKTSTLNKDGLNLLFRSTTNGGFMFTAGITNMGAPGLAH
jgi:hypothetical protein